MTPYMTLAGEYLEMLKIRLGLTQTSRDQFLLFIIAGTLAILDKENGIPIDPQDPAQAGFIMSYSAWVYESKGETGGMPRHLQFQLHNLIIRKDRVGEPIDDGGGIIEPR